MPITGSNRLAMSERRWVERPARSPALQLPLFIVIVLMLVGSGIVSLRANAAPAASGPASAVLDSRLSPSGEEGTRTRRMTRLAPSPSQQS